MATFTANASVDMAAEPFVRAGGTIIATTATSITVQWGDGSTTVFEGTDLTNENGDVTRATYQPGAPYAWELDGIWLTVSTLKGLIANPALAGAAVASYLLGADWVEGSSLSDTLVGHAGDDTIEGGLGDDLLDGDGHGGVNGTADWAVYWFALDGVQINLLGGTATGGAGSDTLQNFENVIASGYGDSVIGDANNNTLWGWWGDDTVDGGAGNDVLLGQADNDVLFGGLGNDSLDGGIGVDVLAGGAGNDSLVGGEGADRLEGGEGNDTYWVDGLDTVVEAAGGGTDRVIASLSYGLAGGLAVEALSAEVGSAVIHLTGNSFNNVLSGNSAANILNGGGGNDQLLGGAGNDRLLGGSGNDKLLGSFGNDIVTGGRGRDVMTGGSGRDRFTFDDSDTTASKISADYIVDLRGAAGDRIDVRAVDANRGRGGDQSFAFVGTDPFTGAGQVRYQKEGSFTFVYLNTDADATAEAVIRLKGSMDLSKGWFLL